MVNRLVLTLTVSGKTFEGDGKGEEIQNSHLMSSVDTWFLFSQDPE